MQDKLYITIKSDEQDFMAFQNLVPKRMEHIAGAPDTQVDPDVPVVNALAKRLHPSVQHLVVDSVKQITPTIKLIKFVPTWDTKELAFFRAGQYISLDLDIGGSKITRPYSIASSPKDSLDGYYELAIKHNDAGFAAKYLYDNIKKGDHIDASGPAGHFYYEDLRDKKHIVGIAGGSGITPFRSLARAIADGTIKATMTLFYGANTVDELAFKSEFEELQKKSNGNFKVVFVVANEDIAGCEKGFITAKLLQKYEDLPNSSLFICGPKGMYNFVAKELEPLNLRKKCVRFELFGQPTHIVDDGDFPRDKAGKVFKVTVHQGPNTWVIDASSEETLVCSMEKAGIRPPTKCRSGSCGFCRSQLVSGEVFVSKKDDGRRYGDIEFGFIHPCSTFPLSDCEIIVPPTKF